ncbi:MAG: hypothetical protein WKF47_11050 [Geodermatophilaceae bacterium]
MEEVRRAPPGPFDDLEVIRVEAGMSTSRFCQLIDMPERTWRRWQASAAAGEQVRGPWPAPVAATVQDAVIGHAQAHPAWGHRKVLGHVPLRRAAGVPGDGAADHAPPRAAAGRGLPAPNDANWRRPAGRCS